MILHVDLRCWAQSRDGVAQNMMMRFLYSHTTNTTTNSAQPSDDTMDTWRGGVEPRHRRAHVGQSDTTHCEADPGRAAGYMQPASTHRPRDSPR